MLDPICWRWWFPEIEHFEDAAERREAWRKARAKTRFARLCWAAVLVVSLILFNEILTGLLIPPIGTFDDRNVTALVLLLAGSSNLMYVKMAYVPTMRRNLREQLAVKGIILCKRCSYNLEGNTSGRCPECGKSAK